VLAYETDRDGYALLLERCVPGTTLADSRLSTEDMLVAAAGVANRLWTRTPPTESTMDDMGAVTREWAVLVRERMAWHQPPFDRGLVAHAADLLATLPSSATRRVVVHGDFNPSNLLAAQRHPWLAIDAKPMVGDPAYDPSPLLCQVDNPFTTTHPEREVRRRYDLVAGLVGEPADRLLAWTLARMVESALWLVDCQQPEPAVAEMRDAAIVARILGV
jgi:streptomycin 6-kinase